MSQYVVWFDSSDTGAPILNNAAGSLIAVLDACLVNGFNSKSVSTIVVSGGIATVTSGNHNFSGTFSKDVRIEGATPAGLNGRKSLLSVTTNTFTFDATGISDQTATGIITAKRDSLGWVKEFSGTNKAIYKRTDINATTMRLRVEDATLGLDARVRMIETATDVDTYTGFTPSEVAVPGGYYWTKGANNTTAKTWRLVGDSRGFYLFAQDPTYPKVEALRFGDFKSFKAGDAYNCTLVGYTSEKQSGVLLALTGGFTTTYSTSRVARGFNQTGGSVPVGYVGFGSSSSGTNTTNLPGYPSPIDSGLLINPQVLITEDVGAGNYCARGIDSGMCQLLARIPFSDLQIIEPVVSLPNRKLLALSMTVSNNASGMQIALDITGPWSY